MCDTVSVWAWLHALIRVKHIPWVLHKHIKSSEHKRANAIHSLTHTTHKLQHSERKTPNRVPSAAPSCGWSFPLGTSCQLYYRRNQDVPEAFGSRRHRPKKWNLESCACEQNINSHGHVRTTLPTHYCLSQEVQQIQGKASQTWVQVSASIWVFLCKLVHTCCFDSILTQYMQDSYIIHTFISL